MLRVRSSPCAIPRVRRKLAALRAVIPGKLARNFSKLAYWYLFMWNVVRM